jgi:diguanylate cyclase (GGDEF)-like protein
MPNNDDKWIDKGYVHKDNLFNRRVTSIRNQTVWNLNEKEALELLKNPDTKRNIFAPAEPVRELTDDEVDMRAFYDRQTPTYSFRYLVRNFRRELTRSYRYKRYVSILVVAVDNLNRIGQEYGVLALDSAIAAAADVLINTCRSDVDMVGRYMEDRFIVLCPETPGRGAMVLAERIRKKFEGIAIQHQWHTIRVNASIGIAYFPGHGKDIESLIAQADLATEIVCDRGGNGVCFAPELSEPPG